VTLKRRGAEEDGCDDGCDDDDDDDCDDDDEVGGWVDRGGCGPPLD